jgi:hypothetical protein
VASLTRDVLVPANCWFAVDRVKDDGDATEWKRRARWRQHRWALRHDLGGHLGSQPYDGNPSKRKDGRLAKVVKVGSRIDLKHAKHTGANFVTGMARAAAEFRLSYREPHQTLNPARLWADLLSSMPLCFNIFGELHGDAARAEQAVRTWWPDAPHGRVRALFEHSPGRLDPEYLGNRSAFDVALLVNPDAPSGRGIIGVETKYHEHAKPERRPSDERMVRYARVTERSGCFRAGWRERLVGTELQQIWLDHLLVLAMLKHPSRAWSFGRFVLVYPSENRSFAAAARAYAEGLEGDGMFEAWTIESLVAAQGALGAETVEKIRERYLQDL